MVIVETRITATELAKSLSDVLNRVHYRQERFLIERSGQPVAVLGPPAPAAGMTWRQFVALLQEVPPAGEDFADDLEAVQSSQASAGNPPWQS